MFLSLFIDKNTPAIVASIQFLWRLAANVGLERFDKRITEFFNNAKGDFLILHLYYPYVHYFEEKNLCVPLPALQQLTWKLLASA